MPEVTKYKDIVISLNDNGQFEGVVLGKLVSRPSLTGLKKFINTMIAVKPVAVFYANSWHNSDVTYEVVKIKRPQGRWQHGSAFTVNGSEIGISYLYLHDAEAQKELHAIQEKLEAAKKIYDAVQTACQKDRDAVIARLTKFDGSDEMKSLL
jgi:hypothetical protein